MQCARIIACPAARREPDTISITPHHEEITMRRGHLLIVPLLIAAAVMLFQYFGADTFTNAETGERHRVGLSTEQETQLGLQAYEDVLAHERTVDSGPELE